MSVTPDQFIEVLRSLSETEPMVTVEPSHITDWSVERRGLLGMPTVTPPDLERVTVTYDNGRDRLVMVVFDRECDIGRAAEMARWSVRHDLDG